MSISVFARRATVGERYVTKGGWPVTVLEIGKAVLVQNDLTGQRHKIDGSQLLWPFKERLISKEAITMARALTGKKRVGKKAPAAKKDKKAAAAKHVAVPAGKLNRVYNGKPHIVEATADGYIYEGETFGSLTAVAKKITGYSSISGPAFFKTAHPAAAAEPSLVAQEQ